MKKEKTNLLSLTPSMRQYIESALADKLYEDLSIAVKDEGFAQYCYYTAIEVLKGWYEDFDAVQDDLNSANTIKY